MCLQWESGLEAQKKVGLLILLLSDQQDPARHGLPAHAEPAQIYAGGDGGTRLVRAIPGHAIAASWLEFIYKSADQATRWVKDIQSDTATAVPGRDPITDAGVEASRIWRGPGQEDRLWHRREPIAGCRRTPLRPGTDQPAGWIRLRETRRIVPQGVGVGGMALAAEERIFGDVAVLPILPGDDPHPISTRIAEEITAD